MSSYTRAFAITAIVALLGASIVHVLVLAQIGTFWAAMVHLILFGWITGMIMTVNYHTVPVFSGRDFPTPWLIWCHWGAWSSGVALVTSGLLAGSTRIERAGLLVEWIAAMLFVACNALVFLRGPHNTRRPPPPPIPNQPQIDRLGTWATKIAGIAQPLSAGILWATRSTIISGTWMLAAEHLVTLGWIMLMIVGVAYHVLPRFSGRGVRGANWARWQLLCHGSATTLIVLGLGYVLLPLFTLGGSIMAIAMALFAWTIWPTLQIMRVRIPIVPHLDAKEQRS